MTASQIEGNGRGRRRCLLSHPLWLSWSIIYAVSLGCEVTAEVEPAILPEQDLAWRINRASTGRRRSLSDVYVPKLASDYPSSTTDDAAGLEDGEEDEYGDEEEDEVDISTDDYKQKLEKEIALEVEEEMKEDEEEEESNAAGGSSSYSSYNSGASSSGGYGSWGSGNKGYGGGYGGFGDFGGQSFPRRHKGPGIRKRIKDKWREKNPIPNLKPKHYMYGSFTMTFCCFWWAMLCTAYQLIERPRGIFSRMCHQTIKCFICIGKVTKLKWHEVLFGREVDDNWDGFDSKNTDLEENQENLPQLRAGIGRALDREHKRTMKDIRYKQIELRRGIT